MISAGSGIPNLSGACDFGGACGTALWRRVLSSALVVLPCVLLQACGNSQTKPTAAGEAAMPRSASTKEDSLFARNQRANDVVQAADSFDDRYSAAHSYSPKSTSRIAGDRTGSIPPGSYKLASLSPDLPYGLPAMKQQPQTRLVGFDNSAFPYSGGGGKGGHYSDNRVLVHVPAGFDVHRPGVIVVFFHGHRATLERDV